MKNKAYFSPYLFNSFFDRWDATDILAHCERWGRFLSRQGIILPVDYLDMLNAQIRRNSASKSPRQRWILQIPVSFGHEQTRMEFHFFGGILPNCDSGFVQSQAVQFENPVFVQMLNLKLADVIELPLPSMDDEILLMGSSWALYLRLKVAACRDWQGWHWSDISAPPEIAAKTLSVLTEEFGQEVLSFKYPSEIKRIDEWLVKCDSEMKPQTEEALALLFSYKKVSMKAWRKLRLR